MRRLWSLAMVMVFGLGMEKSEGWQPEGWEGSLVPSQALEQGVPVTETEASEEKASTDEKGRWLTAPVIIIRGRSYVAVRPFLEALDWFHDPEAEGITFRRDKAVLVLNVREQKATLVEEEGAPGRTVPMKGFVRDGRTYATLRDLVRLLGGHLEYCVQTGLIRWEKEKQVWYLASRLAPVDHLGLMIVIGSLRGRRPSKAWIRRRLQQRLLSLLRQQGIRGVVVSSFKETQRRQLPFVLVASYTEEQGEPYHEGFPLFVVGEPDPEDIDAYGTDITCTFTLKRPSGEEVEWEGVTLTAFSPMSVRFAVPWGASQRTVRRAGEAALRREAVQEWESQLKALVLPSCLTLWRSMVEGEVLDGEKESPDSPQSH
ncbi:MAG TPA: copper amine oxidase N-terminal domain-containing protein [Armatimonadetes bacterium]|nr:copper amine oxidase N-terminal domain-containing protein [Armatimonadota bacterium]